MYVRCRGIYNFKVITVNSDLRAMTVYLMALSPFITGPNRFPSLYSLVKAELTATFLRPFCLYLHNKVDLVASFTIRCQQRSLTNFLILVYNITDNHILKWYCNGQVANSLLITFFTYKYLPSNCYVTNELSLHAYQLSFPWKSKATKQLYNWYCQMALPS